MGRDAGDIRGYVGFALAAAAIGAGAAIARGYFRGGLHYEAVAALFVLLPLLDLLALRTVRGIRLRTALWPMVVLATLIVLGFFGGWIATGLHRQLWDDLVGIMLAYWVISAASLFAILAFARWIRPLRTGPYCRGCGYCLIGVPQRRCPECGRAFTLEELGITEAELVPPAA